MDPLTAARAQMEVSLGFHMIFAALGIGMPLLMVIAEGMWLFTKKDHYRALARKWGKVTALLFAVGAVSGTALSFELGLLWPHFMQMAGGVIGPAFALEGYAFFIEAIFVGLYLYGWDRLSPKAHFWTGIPVAVSGLASGVLVVAANAWMQVPVGFSIANGKLIPLDATVTFQSPVWATMSVHSSLACYIAVGFAVAGVYAAGILRGRNDAYHRSALGISLLVAAVAALAQLPSGDRSAKAIARYEPAKLAAAEAHFETAEGASLLLGGVPDPAAREVKYALRIPKLLSVLATGDPDARVTGLNDIPRDLWPNVVVSHVAFEVMVASGMALIAVSVAYWLLRWRKHDTKRPLMWAIALASPLGFLALEAGWVVTEVGRQPWIIAGVLRTRDAVTPAADLRVSFFAFTVLYLFLGAVVVTLLRYLGRNQHAD